VIQIDETLHAHFLFVRVAALLCRSILIITSFIAVGANKCHNFRKLKTYQTFLFHVTTFAFAKASLNENFLLAY